MCVRNHLFEVLASRAFNDRTIILDGEIDHSASVAVVSKLLLLDAEDPNQDIRIYIDSTQGSLVAGFAIYDTMQYISADVSTWAIGSVESVAQLIFCSGAQDKRYALPASRFQLRRPSLTECAVDRTGELSCDVHHELIGEMVRIFSQRTGQAREIIAQDLSRGRHLSLVEAAAYGLVDHIVGGAKNAPQNN